LGHEVAAALFVGGIEKVEREGEVDLGDIPVIRADGRHGEALGQAISDHGAEAVLDLSDEPVLGYRRRMEMAAVALAAGLPYLGADFTLEPAVEGPPLPRPTLGVIGTGKRTGKTAISGEAARIADRVGLRPVVVAMGRGGPPAPQVARAGSVSLDDLLRMAGEGRHAASDYLEDAVTSGVTTVGARRCAGGLAGRPYVSNVREAAARALEEDPGLVILEGSGSAMPPVPWDAGILVCPATAPEEHVAGYLGPYRLLLSDLVVLTMGAGPDVGPQHLATLRSHVSRLRPNARIVLTDLRPVPLKDVGGRKVYLATTAPRHAGDAMVSHLEEGFGCEVVGITHHLADRARLREDLAAAPRFDVLLTELKAAAIDVAAEHARSVGAEVVFVDNRPVTLEGDGDLPVLLEETARLATARAAERTT